MRNSNNYSDEKWRSVPNFRDQYQISNYGRVRSMLTGRISYGHVSSTKSIHKRFTFKYRGKVKGANIAHLVMRTFSKDTLPFGRFFVRYKDGSPDNLHIDNLEIGAPNRGVLPASRFKLKESEVEEIKELLAEKKLMIIEIAKTFNVSPTSIQNIKQGKRKGYRVEA